MNFSEPYGGHLAVSVGTASLVSAVCFFGKIPVEIVLVFGLTFAGGLFPDLDTQSTPSKWAARIGVLVCLYLIAWNPPWEPSGEFWAAVIGILYMATKAGKHRGWTHSIYVPIGITFLAAWLGLVYYGIAFSIGILSHLAADKGKFNH